MKVELNIPDSVVAELNAYAVTCGYANSKAMLAAYIKSEVLAARTAKLVMPKANVIDVVIT